MDATRSQPETSDNGARAIIGYDDDGWVVGTVRPGTSLAFLTAAILVSLGIWLVAYMAASTLLRALSHG